MQCYTELTAPTAVTHSLSLPFLSPSANNLVVAKTNLLQIFSFKSVITTTGRLYSSATNDADLKNPPSSVTRPDRQHTTKLVLVAQYELSGSITSLARVRILQSKSGGEALLVALRDAKLSLVEWDPERCSISTISIHYYEREDILSSPWEPDISECVNYLSVDPSSRCAVLKFGSRHLAILPFHQNEDDLVDDDLGIDDYDPDIDGERPDRKQSLSKISAEHVVKEKTPYAASFVLSLLALDPNLSHPLHLTFLYEYREPTFGVLYSQVASSLALLPERRDNVSYAVYTLDLEQRASTTLLSLTGLPYDLSTVIPLSRSIGGAILVGGNEIIHVDQSGKTTGVAVNEFAKQCSSFALTDQSSLNMRLEHCLVKQLGSDSTDLLVILNNGELAILSFKIDGRSVSSISIRRVADEHGGNLVFAGATCVSMVGRGRIFMGSEDCDSLVIGWSRGYDRPKRQKSRNNTDIDRNEEEVISDEEDIEDDEDDLYAETKLEDKTHTNSTLSDANENEYNFRKHDHLSNLGPMTGVALRNLPQDTSNSKAMKPIIEILSSNGLGEGGGLTLLQENIRPNKIEQYNLADAHGIWSVRTRSADANVFVQEDYDKYIIASSEEKSTVYTIKADSLNELKDTEFEADAGATIDVGVIGGGTKTVQVLRSELRIYDGDFGLAQILPLADEDKDEEPPKVISASFADPYVLLIREDQGALILREDDSGDLEVLDNAEALRNDRWLSGSLYEDSNDILRLEFPEDSEDELGNALLFLLSINGGLQIFRLPSLHTPVFKADGLSFLPPFLSTEFMIRRSSARESIIEITMMELGDAIQKSPFLILRTADNDLIIYQPYQSPIAGSKDTALRWLKISNSHLSRPLDAALPEHYRPNISGPLRQMHNVGGYSTAFMPGPSPCFIIKSAASQPQIINVAETSVRSLTQFHTSNCPNGFLCIDAEGQTYAAQLPLESQYDTGWVTRRVHLGEECHALGYHLEKDVYVIGTSTSVPFKLPHDDFHAEWAAEDTTLLPQAEQCSVKLLDSKTLSVISSHALDSYEIVTTIKTLSLEVSETTHAREELVCVGTAFIRGEDLPSAGKVYVFAVIDVVPDPERTGTGHALKLIAKEDVKAAVTALSSIGTQGFLLVAQGQKCMVRGLKEDGSLLPVAFMDMQCYVSVMKELPGTGLCVMGDAVKDLWFTGYFEEPYSLRLFGKSPRHIEVMAADLLPDGKQLFIVAADADCNLQILQFDPDHPKSLSGQRLLHHSTFHTSHFPSTMTLLPSTSSNTPSPILLTNQSGSLAIITPLPASAHRTLSALQSHLQNTLPHPLGLNPRGYRMPSSGPVGEATAIGRGGVLDGMILRRWMEGGSWRRWGSDPGEGEDGLRRLISRAVGGRQI